MIKFIPQKELIEIVLTVIFFILFLKFSINLANYIDKIEGRLKNDHECSNDEWKDTHS